MNALVAISNFISENYQPIITSISTILTGVIGICLMVPGDAPEKQLQSVVDFLSKYSKK